MTRDSLLCSHTYRLFSKKKARQIRQVSYFILMSYVVSEYNQWNFSKTPLVACMQHPSHGAKGSF